MLPEFLVKWGVEQWSLAVAVLALLGFDGKNGFSALRWVFRGFKPPPDKPLLLTVAETLPKPLPPPPKLGAFGLPTGRPVVGRDADLAKLRALLAKGTTVAVTNSGAVLHGQGGIGKSTLARHYAETHGGDYHGVLWVRAETRQALIDGLMRLCAPLELPIPDQATETHAKAVIANIQTSGQNWLFIYDNVESLSDIADLIPQNTHLIVTTRAGTGWPGWQVLPTDVLAFDAPDAPATQLLMQAANRTDDPAGAMALAADLGGLPLGLVVMGAYIRAQGGTWAENRTRLAEVLDKVPENEGYPTSICGAVQLSLNRLPPDAQIVANLCAWWAAEGLTADLISNTPQGWLWNHWPNLIPEPVQSLASDAARTRAAFATLAASSLITGDGGQYAMHRMTAAALRAMQSKDSPHATAATALLAAVYPGGENTVNNSANWPLCKTLTPHVRALWNSGYAPEIAAMDFLLNQSSIYLNKIADHRGELAMAQAAHDLTIARLPSDHPEIAVALATLGDAMGNSGDLAGAADLLARAVTLNETHRPGSADLANTYSLHGSRLLDLALAGDGSQFAAALARIEQCHDLRTTLFGPNSNPVAQALINIGAVHHAQGRMDLAADFSERSLTIWRDILPPKDARLAAAAMNTGAVRLQSGAADQAEALLSEALEIREDILADHPTHPNRRNAADWLISCLLVRAAAGENAGLRQAQAKDLCNRYGFDFNESVEHAKQYPYTPTKP